MIADAPFDLVSSTVSGLNRIDPLLPERIFSRVFEK